MVSTWNVARAEGETVVYSWEEDILKHPVLGPGRFGTPRHLALSLKCFQRAWSSISFPFVISFFGYLPGVCVCVCVRCIWDVHVSYWVGTVELPILYSLYICCWYKMWPHLAMKLVFCNCLFLTIGCKLRCVLFSHTRAK